MRSLGSLMGLNLLIVAALMVSLWLVSLRLKDVSIVDVAWGVCGALIALPGLILTDGALVRRGLLAAMVLTWGLRLAFHIGARKRGSAEDFRYAAMRASDPTRFPVRSLFTVFLLQALLIWAISFPVQVGQYSPAPASLTFMDALGFLVWLAGLAVESQADKQLRGFLAKPENKGRVMDQGLWKYSRHPNYFGDSLVWWGIFLVCAATPRGWLTVFSPLLMTFFLMKVSGVPLLERALAKRRPGYGEYMRRTSAFFPLPPRRAGSDSIPNDG